MKGILDFFKNQGAEFGFHILMAIVVLVIGYILIKIFVKILRKCLLRTKLDGTVIGFIKSTVKVVSFIILAIIVATILQIPTAPLLTAFGAVGLAVSFALKDSLTNMASGLIILLTKEFSLNDYVEIDNVSGIVKKIGLIHTTLNTIDNKRIYVPNGQITSTKMINYSAEENRRLDLIFSINYDENVEKAKEVLTSVILANEYAIKDPEPVIRVCAHSMNAIDIAVKVWVKSEHYWDLNFDLYESVKSAFDKEDIHIPFRQMDIRIVKASNE